MADILNSIRCKRSGIWRVSSMEKQPEQSDNQKPIQNWQNYYELIEGKSHTQYLEMAVNTYCKDKENALDVGAGSLRDTKFLLNEGFKVTAIDTSPLSSEFAKELHTSSLAMFSGEIREYSFPKENFSLVNAQGIFFHFSSDQLQILLKRVCWTLKSGGVLCADFIGENDTWNHPERKNIIVNKKILTTLLEGYEIKYIDEFERDESEETAKKKGKPAKHWHHINVVAVKR